MLSAIQLDSPGGRLRSLLLSNVSDSKPFRFCQFLPQLVLTKLFSEYFNIENRSRKWMAGLVPDESIEARLSWSGDLNYQKSSRVRLRCDCSLISDKLSPRRNWRGERLDLWLRTIRRSNMDDNNISVNYNCYYSFTKLLVHDYFEIPRWTGIRTGFRWLSRSGFSQIRWVIVVGK